MGHIINIHRHTTRLQPINIRLLNRRHNGTNRKSLPRFSILSSRHRNIIKHSISRNAKQSNKNNKGHNLSNNILHTHLRQRNRNSRRTKNNTRRPTTKYNGVRNSTLRHPNNIISHNPSTIVNNTTTNITNRHLISLLIKQHKRLLRRRHHTRRLTKLTPTTLQRIRHPPHNLSNIRLTPHRTLSHNSINTLSRTSENSTKPSQNTIRRRHTNTTLHRTATRPNSHRTRLIPGGPRRQHVKISIRHPLHTISHSRHRNLTPSLNPRGTEPRATTTGTHVTHRLRGSTTPV